MTSYVTPKTYTAAPPPTTGGVRTVTGPQAPLAAAPQKTDPNGLATGGAAPPMTGGNDPARTAPTFSATPAAPAAPAAPPAWQTGGYLSQEHYDQVQGNAATDAARVAAFGGGASQPGAANGSTPSGANPTAGAPVAAAPAGQPAAPTEAPGVAPPWLRDNANAISTTNTPAWAGGPNVTQSAVNRSGMPAIEQGSVDRNGLPDLSQGLDTSGFADFDTDFAAASQRGADAAYRGATQYMDEDFTRDRAALESQLTNQGFARDSQAFKDELSRMERGQSSARQSAAFQAQGVGHQQAGDLLMRALDTRRLQGSEAGQDAATRLSSRGMLGGERTGDVDRRFDQSMGARGLMGAEGAQDADRRYNQTIGIANLGLGARGQDRAVEQAMQSASGQAAAANAAAASSNYNANMQRDLALRGMGMTQDQNDFNNMMRMIEASRGGVNMPNFGAPQPLDVGSANSIASNNSNQQTNRNAADRAGLYGLGGQVLGNVNWGSIFGGP